MQEVLNNIRQKQDSFSAAQKIVASYVLDNYQQIPFLSINELSSEIGVSNNTIVKFCEQLGFPRFASFKKFVSNYISQHAEPNLVISKKLSDSTDGSHYSKTVKDDVTAIRKTLSDPYNQENLPKLLDMMNQADHIYITGARSSSILASLFVTELRYLNYKVHELNAGSGDYLDQLSLVDEKDLVIGLTFPRYTKAIVSGLKHLHVKGIPVVLITDTGLSPAQPYAALSFHCYVNSSYYFPCLTGCMSLINAICRAAGAIRKNAISDHIQELERNLLDQGVFL